MRKLGINVSIDEWEIMLGDSIIRKVFDDLLSKCDIFFVLLSRTSVESKWVKEELDAAMVRKIEGATRIIPLIKEKCDIPPQLRTLLRVDLSENFDSGIREIAKSIYGVSDKPPLGPTPRYVIELSESVGSLSRVASTIGKILLHHCNDQLSNEITWSAEEIHNLVPVMNVTEINDAVDELKEYGLIKTRVFLNCAPYNFSSVTPKYQFFLTFRDEGLNYDPIADIKTVTVVVVSNGKLDAKTLNALCGIPPLRLNRVIDYLDDNGKLKVERPIGTAPFNFWLVEATRKTRQFAAEKCK